MKKIYYTLTIIGLLIFGCKKSNDAPSKEILLTQKEWVVTAERTQKNNEPWKDVFSTDDPCFKDNRIIFRSNGKYDITEGPTKCNPGDPQIAEQDESWAFTDNKTKITLTHNGGFHLTILQLDETTFKMLHEYTQSGSSYKEETTLSHP